MAIFDQERKSRCNRRASERREDVVKRLSVTQEARNKLVVAEVVDGRPQECPADSDAEEHDKESFHAGFGFVLQHDVCSVNCGGWVSIHGVCIHASEPVPCDGSNAVASALRRMELRELAQTIRQPVVLERRVSPPEGARHVLARNSACASAWQ